MTDAIHICDHCLVLVVKNQFITKVAGLLDKLNNDVRAALHLQNSECWRSPPGGRAVSEFL